VAGGGVVGDEGDFTAGGAGARELVAPAFPLAAAPAVRSAACGGSRSKSRTEKKPTIITLKNMLGTTCRFMVHISVREYTLGLRCSIP
jgi:hypothetical protein